MDSGIIIKVFIISIFCQGLNVLLSENMILGFIRDYIYSKNLSNIFIYILKPIVLCHLCFASFWGTIIYINISEFNIIEYIICVVSASYFNVILGNIKSRTE
jgi:hypothetical protein